MTEIITEEHVQKVRDMLGALVTVVRHHTTIEVTFPSRQLFNVGLSILDGQKEFHAESWPMLRLRMVLTPISFLTRPYLTVILPKALAEIEPLLNSIGYRWSNHYVHEVYTEQCWSLLHIETGQAGQVGMIADEALYAAVRKVNFALTQEQARSIQVANVLMKAATTLMQQEV